jgi:hypothetical protein
VAPVDRIPDDHCRRTGQFQVVFTDTQLTPETEVHVAREDDAEWSAAVDLMLAALRAERSGETASNAAWQDLTMWLNDGERLETFIRRTLKTVDASIWLLSLSVTELGSKSESDVLKRLHQLVLSQPVRD